jgi:hypothetical protein
MLFASARQASERTGINASSCSLWELPARLGRKDCLLAFGSERLGTYGIEVEKE